jgi:TPR repeat protein
MVGKGVSHDYAEALKLARRAAEKRNRVGEAVLGELYRLGWGVAKSAREAVTYHTRALAQGEEASKRALCQLATEGVSEATAALHRLGLDAPLRAADAAVVAAGRCPLGDLAAQQAACEVWAGRPIAAIRAAAEAGDLAAMEDLAERFYTGARGALKDEAQAVLWWRRSAAGNVARAQFNLGIMHRGGLGGLEKSDAKAVALIRAAAGAGLAEALTYLGVLYAQGWGVPRDVREATKWFAKAAAQGTEEAIANLRTFAAAGEAEAAAALRRLRLSP